MPAAAAAAPQLHPTNSSSAHHHAANHSNPNAPIPSMGSMRLHGNDASDPQVQVIAHDAPLPTLCDVVCEALLDGRDPVRPTVSRLLLVGELPSKDDPPRVIIDDCVLTATKRVNLADPTGGKGSSIADPMNLSGLFVELPAHFVQLVESEPAHLLAYAQELHARVVQKKCDGVSKVHVVMYVDDIATRSCNKLFYMDLPPSVSGGQLPDDYVLEEVVVEQAHKLLQLLNLAQSQSKMQIDNFLANAKNQHVNLLPRTPFVEKCLTSGLCLTLDEYVQLFGSAPNVVRGNEVLHPVEEPLPYTL